MLASPLGARPGEPERAQAEDERDARDPGEVSLDPVPVQHEHDPEHDAADTCRRLDERVRARSQTRREEGHRDDLEEQAGDAGGNEEVVRRDGRAEDGGDPHDGEKTAEVERREAGARA